MSMDYGNISVRLIFVSKNSSLNDLVLKNLERRICQTLCTVCLFYEGEYHLSGKQVLPGG